MLLDAEARRHGGAEKHAEDIFRISFSAWNAAQESQNLRARSQRRSYGFAARLAPVWKADNRSPRRIPRSGLVHWVAGWCEVRWFSLKWREGSTVHVMAP